MKTNQTSSTPGLEVIVVLYRPRIDELRAALTRLTETAIAQGEVRVHLWHNDGGPAQTSGLQAAYDQARTAGLHLQVHGIGRNLGFGPGINATLPSINAPFVLLLNQDAIPESGALQRLWRTALEDAPDVAAWEMRQIPYEHPKDHDPVSGDTGWVSGSAVLLRTDALRAVQGFEPRFFMYCEDVDLSWRLRCAGWRLRYLPRCAVVHHTYREPGETKPLAFLQGRYANLCLRARYAGRSHVRDAVLCLLREIRAPEVIPGHHAGAIKALLRFTRNYPYFRRTRQAAPGFEPCFNGWDYEQRREGSFHPFRAQHESVTRGQAVSVIVRAGDNPDRLDEWLACIEGQIHPPNDVILVGGTAEPLQRVLEHWSARFDLRALPATTTSLEQVAAVHAQADWWITMQSDCVLPYADHIEVLMQAALLGQADAAVSLTWVIEGHPQQRPEAHRRHARRHNLAGPANQRPTRLMHRRAAGPGEPTTVQVEKTTAVCYVPAEG